MATHSRWGIINDRETTTSPPPLKGLKIETARSTISARAPPPGRCASKSTLRGAGTGGVGGVGVIMITLKKRESPRGANLCYLPLRFAENSSLLSLNSDAC